MKVIDYLKETFIKETDSNYQNHVRPMVICKDGFYISIQGGTNTHYCKPREYCNIYEFNYNEN